MSTDHQDANYANAIPIPAAGHMGIKQTCVGPCPAPSTPAVAGNYGIDLPPGERMDLVSRCALASVVEVAQSSVVLKVLIERLPSLLMDLVVRLEISNQQSSETITATVLVAAAYNGQRSHAYARHKPCISRFLKSVRHNFSPPPPGHTSPSCPIFWFGVAWLVDVRIVLGVLVGGQRHSALVCCCRRKLARFGLLRPLRWRAYWHTFTCWRLAHSPTCTPLLTGRQHRLPRAKR